MPCAHTFCKQCLTATPPSTCPVPGCGSPVSAAPTPTPTAAASVSLSPNEFVLGILSRVPAPVRATKVKQTAHPVCQQCVKKPRPRYIQPPKLLDCCCFVDYVIKLCIFISGSNAVSNQTGILSDTLSFSSLLFSSLSFFRSLFVFLSLSSAHTFAPIATISPCVLPMRKFIKMRMTRTRWTSYPRHWPPRMCA